MLLPLILILFVNTGQCIFMSHGPEDVGYSCLCVFFPSSIMETVHVCLMRNGAVAVA